MMQDVTSGRLAQTVQVGPLDASLPSLPAISMPTYTAEWMATAPVGSPAWYFRRLMGRLDARTPVLLRWDAYYRGDQPLAFASSKFREAFGGRFSAFSSNFCALVVDGTRERMEVTGFTFPGSRATRKAWRIWQENDMDAMSQIAHTEALIKSVVYTLVEPQRDGMPRITVEDPFDAITESDPRDQRIRRAGLKRWVDDEGHLVAYLYLPESIWKLRSSGRWERGASGTYTMQPFPEDGEPFPFPNPLRVVPLIPLVNRPRLGGEGQSEIDPVMSNQDAVNKYRADALVAAEFAAFRQRWATGLEIPTDPVTGQPVEPFKAAVDRLWVVPPPDPDDPNPAETRFGEFSATDLEPYQRMIESEIGAMSSISRMPYHYLLGQPQAVPPSGESLKSSEAGLISKVRTQMIHFGEGWEETAALCLIASGDPAGRDRTITTEWRDPETRNEGVRADATTKVYSTGIIDRNEARVALGYAPVEEIPATVPPPDIEGEAVEVDPLTTRGEMAQDG
jgi:hypothetical protein